MQDLTKKIAKKNLTSRSTWLRLIYIVLFAVSFYVAEIIIVVIVVVQFLTRLLTGEINPRLQSFGDSVGKYFHQVTSFLTYHTDDLPFPFASWPEAGKPTATKAKKKKAARKPAAGKSAKTRTAIQAPPPANEGGPKDAPKT